MPVRIEDTLYGQARAQAKAEHRTIAGQIEYWAIIGRTALDNPDLPIDFIRELLVVRQGALNTICPGRNTFLMNSDIQVLQSSLFRRAYKKLHPNQKADVDDAITEIIKDPTFGEQKKGDLAGVFVYKFKFNGPHTLLAYDYDAVNRLLLLLGSHENFYRTLKR